MSAKISNIHETHGKLTFTLSNVDVSYANAIRRTILSDIPIVVFKTSPYNQNKCTIYANTTRLNNEIIKQRLSCIPIVMKDLGMAERYAVELDVENNTDSVITVTTKHFKVKDKQTDSYLDEGQVRTMFPPFVPDNGRGEYFIELVRLRPRLSADLPGEKIKLSCDLSVSSARDDGTFNVTGTCSFGSTVNDELMAQQLELQKQKWKDEGHAENEIKKLSKNWMLLEGQRFIIDTSFDYVIESVGIYENIEIIVIACRLLIDKLSKVREQLENDDTLIRKSEVLMENCYDVILNNEDYTIGNMLNYEIYEKQKNIVKYVGFKKMHPHDHHSVLRIASTTNAKTIVLTAVEHATESLKQIQKLFL